MNWSEMQENWNELRALVQAHWPKLSGTARWPVHAHARPLRAVLLYLFQRRYRRLLRCADRKGDLKEAYWRRELHRLACCGGWATLLHLRTG